MKGKLLVVEYWHSGRESDRMVRLEDYLKLSAENAKLDKCIRLFAFPEGRLEHEDVERVARQVLLELEKDDENI